MNLPHKEPLVFAKEVIELNKETATVFCKFDDSPTLPQFIEAAAQSSCAFEFNNKKAKIGFLTKAFDIELLTDTKERDFLIKVKLEVQVNNMRQFSFEAYEKKSNVKIATGNFTILIQE